MRRLSGPTLAALVCSALVALLYVSPVLPDVARTGLDWPIWIDHPEGLIHTNYGKWWALPPHHYLVDGSSGEFPIYYPCLSDSLVNVAAAALGAPAMSVQAVLFGPLLGAAFLLLNYLSLAAVLGDRRVALVASLLISLGGNSTFQDRPEPVSGLSLQAVLHVPFQVISLATAQSLGWVLMLPCLSLTHLAYRDGSRARAVAAGALLAALFYSHTLTFVNAGAAQLAYLVFSNAQERARDGRFRAWLAALGLVGLAFVGLVATRPSLSFAVFVALGGIALLPTFLVDPRKRFYLWSYGTAGLLALPYVLLLGRHARALALVQDAWNQVQMMAVGLTGFALFFAAYLVAAAFGGRSLRDDPARTWILSLLAATAFLAVNHLWHWGNHPYRYAIHMLFPLSILAALGLRQAPRPLTALLGLWLGAVCLYDVAGFATGRSVSVRFRVAEPERASFLESVRRVTGREDARGQRLLAPAELPPYPRGLVQQTMLMNYSRIQSFVPDYRHVLWPERYRNRMGLFCFLFPGYPNQDYPFGWRACDEELEPDQALVTIHDPRLRTQILPVYRIGYAAAPGKPFSVALKEAAARYGWPIVVATDNAAFLRTDVPSLPGIAPLAREDGPADALVIRVTPVRAGPHVLVLGGRRLEERLTRLQLDGRALVPVRRRGNWAVVDLELATGSHRLELPSLDTAADPQADYLYFAAVVSRESASEYLTLGSAVAGAAAADRR
ncbi:MAG: hypothetical protein ACHP85_13770 [Burkholderiales bacterium]